MAFVLLPGFVVGLVQSSFLSSQVSGLLLRFMCLPLHVVVVLLCIVFRAS